MKKVFCVLACFFMVISLCSCQNEAAVSSENEIDSQPMLGGEAVSSTQDQAQDTTTESVTQTTTITTTQTKTTVITQTTTKATPTKEPVTTSTTVKPGLPPFRYTVNDAENARDLSTERKGFSFGVAKDGVPHNQSVINQQTFDAFEYVQALALDTKTQKKIMYLTFDNGYEYKNLTADILDTLKEKNVKAAFFVTLSYARQNPKLVRRMIDEGHIVGNHSATHPSFPKLTRTQMANEIATLDNYLRENFAYTSPYFRFPSGEHSECALELVTSIGFKSIFWSVAYADWDTSSQQGADYAFSTVTSRFHPGAVILLHAVSQDNTDALGRIIDEAHNQGYQFQTLDEYAFKECV